MSIEINRESIKYCPYHCEENIWHLAGRPEFSDYDPRVVFISNAHRLVHFEAQRICDGTEFICWDYHVILIAKDESNWFVFDPDTDLPWCCGLPEYLTASFPFGESIPEAPLFRVMRAQEYIQNLSSDRRHMHGTDAGFQQPPPPWAVIDADKSTAFNLWQFVDMAIDGMGKVVNLSGLREQFVIG